MGNFIVKANETAQASAERRGELSQTFEKLPRFLSELKPTMEDLGALSDEMTPVISDLGDAAPDLNRFILALGPFSRQSVPSLDSLGEAVKVGGPALQDTEPLLEELRDFGVDANPVSKNLDRLLTSFDETGGIERLMDYIFFQVTAINGFDSLSHYLRAGLIASTSCSFYATSVAFGCESTFGEAEVANAADEPRQGEDRIATCQTCRGRRARRRSSARWATGSARSSRARIRSSRSSARPRSSASARASRTGRPAPYGDPEPFLDYLLGNDE